jgi:WD40 repeat protein
MDNTLQVWNIYTGDTYAKIPTNETALSLDWNYNGSLLGFTNKEKMVHIVDPRANKIEMSTKAHESIKSQKMLFLGNTSYAFSCGFTKSNERQIKLYDLRNFETAVQSVHVDTQTGIMNPFYDADMGLIYVPGRVNYNILYYREKEILNFLILVMDQLSMHLNIDLMSLRNQLLYFLKE